MRKIDIHCHTTRSQLRDVVPAGATLDVIEHEMETHHIDVTVVLATYFPESGSGISNYRLLHWIRDKPSFRMFGSLDFQHYFKAGMRELHELAEENHLAGIKIYAGYQDIDFASPQFQQVISLASRHQLPLMFHGGYLQCHECDDELAVSPHDIAAATRYCEDVPVIISHLAWPFVDELIDVITHHRNIFTDMSGMIDSFKTPHTMPNCIEGLKRFLGSCGPKRLLFGTDFPVQTHSDSIQLVESAMTNYSDADRECVYYHNARQLLERTLP